MTTPALHAVAARYADALVYHRVTPSQGNYNALFSLHEDLYALAAITAQNMLTQEATDLYDSLIEAATRRPLTTEEMEELQDLHRRVKALNQTKP